jgi:4-hydroxy-tetrahydrodipicolinate reductase
MKVALLGYGKMGKVIEPILLERGHEVVLKANSTHPVQVDELKKCEIAIEISQPHLAFEHIEQCLALNIPVVVGTTGWYEHLDAIKTKVESGHQKLLYATNFSIGVQLTFQLNKVLARWMNTLPQYNPILEEIHHTAKLDAPSGTGITLAEGVLQFIDRKDRWVNQPTEHSNELQLTSIRTDHVPGTHSVSYVSPVDTIEIKHTAHNRQGFALGAVLAAEWLINQPSGVYNMEDFLKFEL